jgi:FtsH-binding integral membrane protein
MNRSMPWEMTGTVNPAIARFFNMVYAWMCAGLAVTAIVALLVSQYVETQIANQNYGALSHLGGVFIGLFIAQIVLVMVISAATQRVSAPIATVLFLLYAAITGVTLTGIFLVYTHAALASAFVITAGTFGAMSVYGMVTKRDLSFMGRIMFMLLIGLVIASIVSIFWHNTMLQVVMNYVGVIVFVGLTAYDTQRLKIIAEQTQDNPALAARLSIVGSLTLYLDFINLFLFILRMLGDRRR